jgi:preprotein translocase subunit SecG
MEMNFLLEFTALAVVVFAVAALTLTSQVASSKKQDKPSWGSE